MVATQRATAPARAARPHPSFACSRTHRAVYGKPTRCYCADSTVLVGSLDIVAKPTHATAHTSAHSWPALQLQASDTGWRGTITPCTAHSPTRTFRLSPFAFRLSPFAVCRLTLALWRLPCRFLRLRAATCLKYCAKRCQGWHRNPWRSGECMGKSAASGCCSSHSQARPIPDAAPCSPYYPFPRGKIHTRGKLWSFTVG